MAPSDQRFKLPPKITGSTWANVASALRRTAKVEAPDDDGVSAPVWTCREAAGIVSAVRDMAKGTHDGFPLWYQFAASAFGWSPEEDMLLQSNDQSSKTYPDAAALVDEIDRIASARDAAKAAVPRDTPRLDLMDMWNDPQYLSEIHAALSQDGAEAEWKIPLPACKDPVTGKPAKPVKDPATGKWSCPGGAVTIDDPITAILKSLSKLAPIAIVVGALWIADQMETRHRRKR